MVTYSDLIRLTCDLLTLVMWPDDVLHTCDGGPGIIFGAIIMILLPHLIIYYWFVLLLVSVWRSWKRFGLSIMLLADQVPAGSNWQKGFSKLLTLKLLDLSDQDLNLEARCTTIMSWAPLPFTHWASVKAAWCCQPGCVALCISLDYTDSSRSGRYWELGHL